MQTNELRDELVKIIEGDVSIDEVDLEKMARDTSLFYVKPRLVVFPKHKDDVQKLVAFVASKKQEGMDISVTGRSAGTCMTGGSLTESIIFDTTRYMNHVTDVTDKEAKSEPGVFYRDFEPHTLEKGWIMPSYPASRELAAIGGIISNNSGGEKTLIYGKTEKYVKELEVVYANGETDTLRALNQDELKAKINSGTEGGRIHKEMYDLITSNYDKIMGAKPTVSKNSSGYYLWNVYNKETNMFDLSKLVVGSQGTGGEKTLIYGKTEKYVKELEVVYANGETDTLRALNQDELKAKINSGTEGGRIHKEMYDLITSNYDKIMGAKPTVSKNSSGYYLWNVYNKETNMFDLSKLVVGSQGTLAMVTRATITGIVPKTHRRMLVLFIPSTVHLGEIIPALLKHEPETMESYDDNTFKIAVKFFKDIALRMGGNMITLGFQFLPEFWMVLTGGVPKIVLMAEFAGGSDEEVARQVDQAYEDMKQFGLPMKKTTSDQESKKYWTFRRESFALLRSRLKGMRTAPTIDDIVVHPKDLPEFLPKLAVIFSKYNDLIYTVAGHMGDANFHIIPLIDVHKPGIIDTLHKLMDEVYTLVIEYKGSISAEHNDGLLRTPYLPKMFNQDTIALFEKTKEIFDKQGIFNPKKKVHGSMEYSFSKVDTK
jgi:FAD/FMN-containing dehydrogenase